MKINKKLVSPALLPRYFGIGLFIFMMTAGYYYNLTFIQLVLQNFGTHKLGLSASQVSRDMALLALFTCVTALAFGWFYTDHRQKTLSRLIAAPPFH